MRRTLLLLPPLALLAWTALPIPEAGAQFNRNAPPPAEPRPEPSSVSASRLREAIVWREILGPPKALRR